MKLYEKKRIQGKRCLDDCRHFIECQLHKHRGAFQDTLTKEKTPSGISVNFRIIWENRKTESNVNKCINIDTFIQSCPIMFVLYNETHRHTCE